MSNVVIECEAVYKYKKIWIFKIIMLQIVKLRRRYMSPLAVEAAVAVLIAVLDGIDD